MFLVAPPPPPPPSPPSNAFESDFRSSKMAAGSQFVKKFKLHIDLKWREMRSKVIFGHTKWPPAAIL